MNDEADLGDVQIRKDGKSQLWLLPLGWFIIACWILDWFLMRITTEILQSVLGSLAQGFAIGVCLGQACFISLLGGLCGRCWLKGITIATLLMMVGYVLIFVGLFMVRSVSISFEPSNPIWAAFLLPMFSVYLSAPILLGRQWMGWRLTRLPTETPRAPFGIEELFLITAALASLLSLSRLPQVAWEVSGVDVFRGCAMFGGFFCLASALVVVPSIYIVFRNTGHRLLWLRIFAFYSIAILFGVIVVSAITEFATVGNSQSNWKLGFIIAITASTIATLGIVALLASGFRIARYVQNSEMDALTETEANRALDRALHRRWVLALFLIAICSNMGVSYMVYLRQTTDESHLKVFNRLLSDGGSIALKGRNIIELKLGTSATDASIKDRNMFELNSRYSAAGESLYEYRQMSQIESLGLSETKVTDAVLPKLRQFKRLKSIDLSHTQITDDGFRELQKFNNLEHLSLAGSRVTMAGLKNFFNAIKKNWRLKSIDLSDLNMDDHSLDQLKTEGQLVFSHLSSLALRNNKITDEGVKTLLERYGSFDEKLDLTGNPIDGTGFDEIGSLTINTFRELILDKTRINDTSFGLVLPKLTINGWLSIRETDLTDAILPIFATSPSISGIKLGDGQITEDGLVKHQPQNFQRLSLNSKQFTGRCFDKWKSSIEYLDMSGSGIHDDTIRFLANLPNLRFLRLSDTDITDASLRQLATFEGSIDYLDVSNTQITARGLRESGLPRHQAIHLALNQFTLEEIQMLKSVLTILVGEKSYEP